MFTNYFKNEDKLKVLNKLEQIEEAQKKVLFTLKYYDPTLMALISSALGFLGVDRFILGDTLLGVIKLLASFVGIGLIFYLIDVYFVYRRSQTLNAETVLNF